MNYRVQAGQASLFHKVSKATKRPNLSAYGNKNKNNPLTRWMPVHSKRAENWNSKEAKFVTILLALLPWLAPPPSTPFFSTRILFTICSGQSSFPGIQRRVSLLLLRSFFFLFWFGIQSLKQSKESGPGVRPPFEYSVRFALCRDSALFKSLIGQQPRRANANFPTACEPQREAGLAKYPSNCVRPSELGFGFEKISIQCTTSLKLFTKGRKRILILWLIAIRIDMYI